MVVCKYCSAMLEEGSRFCRRCNRQVADFCPFCGAVVPLEQPHCGKCGRLLLQKKDHFSDFFNDKILYGRGQAGLILRAVATVIDSILLLVAIYLLQMVAYTLLPDASLMKVVAAILQGILFLGYYVYFEGNHGATIGKMALGLRVMTEDYQPCDWRRAVTRTLLRLVDGLGMYFVGSVVFLMSRHYQRLGDMVAKTIVVRTDRF